MKKLYSLLSSAALLFSLPALAAPLAEKAISSQAGEKETRETSSNDKVKSETALKDGKETPVCRGEGG